MNRKQPAGSANFEMCSCRNGRKINLQQKTVIQATNCVFGRQVVLPVRMIFPLECENSTTIVRMGMFYPLLLLPGRRASFSSKKTSRELISFAASLFCEKSDAAKRNTDERAKLLRKFMVIRALFSHC